ncbi:MAG TPA: hypothetical protein VM513_21230 [Kofleriaceae bacterium]|nr:hypothetical protein [Kofleriaceae bacterium]
MTCIGEPISWLRLEAFALDRRDPAIREHVAVCAACRTCLDDVERDVVALPPLALPAPRPARWRRWLPRLAPAFAVAAAAVIALVVWRDDPRRAPGRDDIVHVKGVGEVVLGVMRERAGVVRDDVHTFATGDRFKVFVTCPPAASASVEVAITELATGTVDHPVAPAQIACGNEVAIPGAFSLSGGVHRVCARISDGVTAGATACLELSPE